MAKKAQKLVFLVNQGRYRHDKHENLLRTDDSLLGYLDSMVDLDELDHSPPPDPAREAREERTRLRLEILVALQLIYRKRLRTENREAALPAAIAFRNFVNGDVADGVRIALAEETILG